MSSRDGEIRGYGHGDVVSWKGIPFAAPPVAEHRFRAPRPPQPWDGVRDGRTFGAMAPQGRDGPIPMDSSIPMDEDCLTLNVWAPTPDGISRPVMVWIHGGAYVLGSSAQRIYNGRNLSRLGEVVVVTVNYRVGALGWLDLSSFDTDAGVFETNLGLRD